MQDIQEFFSFSGDIEYVEMQRSVSCIVWCFSPFCCVLLFNFIIQIVSLYINAVMMNGLKLPLLPSRIHKVPRLQYYYR